MARRLEERAVELRDHALTMINRAQTMDWKSNAAEAFRDRVVDDQARLHHCAEELDGAAATLRAHAETVRERIAEIRRIQKAVTDWFSNAAGNVVDAAESIGGAVVDAFGDILHGKPPWHDWPFRPDNLPAPDSVDWLKAGEFFRKQGIV